MPVAQPEYPLDIRYPLRHSIPNWTGRPPPSARGCTFFPYFPCAIVDTLVVSHLSSGRACASSVARTQRRETKRKRTEHRERVARRKIYRRHGSNFRLDISLSRNPRIVRERGAIRRKVFGLISNFKFTRSSRKVTSRAILYSRRKEFPALY